MSSSAEAATKATELAATAAKLGGKGLSKKAAAGDCAGWEVHTIAAVDMLL